MKLTIKEAAQSLDLPLSTVKRWVKQGRIPIQKSGKNYVFEKSVLEKWARTHNLLFLPTKQAIKKESKPEAEETLVSAMKRGTVFYNITGNNVEAVLRSAVDKMKELSEDSREELYARLLQRENLTSTGIGKGIAIPHPRTPLSDMLHPLITTCFLKKPVNFKAVDGKPVFIMFILLSPNPKSHLHLLSRLSFCVRDDTFLEFLKKAPDSDILFSKITEIEAQLDKEQV